MSKDTQSSEDLFSPVTAAQEPQVPPTLSVTSLTKNIRDLLETSFVDVTVEGEISNYLHHRSGHRYWTLKDEAAQISCVFWKTRSTSVEMQSGQHVVCRGRLTVYPPRGNYQLDVFQVRPVGIGALQAAFERLFKKLQAEGLFEEARKRPIPNFPKRIGIVTSATGAAVHDILTVLRRRFPLASVLIRPASVQGVGSELQIAQAIRDFNSLPAADRPEVLIVGRGGGSIEDLWSFNEEAVARAIFASAIPIVSAVGHEVDVTISDYVADLRAPTPTAAAELITPDKNELLRDIVSASRTIQSMVFDRLEKLHDELRSHSSGYGLKYVLVQSLQTRSAALAQATASLRSNTEHALEHLSLRFDRDIASLRALDPTAVLARGYAIVQTRAGEIVTTPELLAIDAQAVVHVHGGTFSIKRID